MFDFQSRKDPKIKKDLYFIGILLREAPELANSKQSIAYGYVAPRTIFGPAMFIVCLRPQIAFPCTIQNNKDSWIYDMTGIVFLTKRKQFFCFNETLASENEYKA